MLLTIDWNLHSYSLNWILKGKTLFSILKGGKNTCPLLKQQNCNRLDVGLVLHALALCYFNNGFHTMLDIVRPQFHDFDLVFNFFFARQLQESFCTCKRCNVFLIFMFSSTNQQAEQLFTIQCVQVHSIQLALLIL